MPKAGIQLKFQNIMVEGTVVVGGDVGGRVLVVVVVKLTFLPLIQDFFDTSLKILTPAPHVVHVTNMPEQLGFRGRQCVVGGQTVTWIKAIQ